MNWLCHSLGFATVSTLCPMSRCDGNPYLRMDTSSSYVNMVWRLHRRGFGATSALDGSFIFDLSISFPEKLLLTLLRIFTRTDGLRNRSTRNRQLCLDHDWSTLIAIVLFPTSTKTRSSVGGRRNRRKSIFSQKIDRRRKRNPNKKVVLE